MNVSNRINLKEQELPKFPSLRDLIRLISNRDVYFPLLANGEAVISIRFNEDGLPMRKVVRRSNYRQTYQLFSRKMQLTKSCESLIEFNGCYILEAIPEIKSYQMQPAEILYVINGEQHRHIPDALINLNDQISFFIEFKPESQLDDEDLICRTALLAKNLPAHKYGYLVVCDDQVSGIQLANAKLLFHAQKTNIPEATLMDIRNMFSSNPMVTIGELLTIFVDVPLIKNYLYQLMLIGTIVYDADELITLDSKIYWKGTAQ